MRPTGNSLGWIRTLRSRAPPRVSGQSLRLRPSGWHVVPLAPGYGEPTGAGRACSARSAGRSDERPHRPYPHTRAICTNASWRSGRRASWTAAKRTPSART